MNKTLTFLAVLCLLSVSFAGSPGVMFATPGTVSIDSKITITSPATIKNVDKSSFQADLKNQSGIVATNHEVYNEWTPSGATHHYIFWTPANLTSYTPTASDFAVNGTTITGFKIFTVPTTNSLGANYTFNVGSPVSTLGPNQEYDLAIITPIGAQGEFSFTFMGMYFDPTIGSCPSTISAAGYYSLTGNIACSTAIAITINAAIGMVSIDGTTSHFSIDDTSGTNIISDLGGNQIEIRNLGFIGSKQQLLINSNNFSVVNSTFNMTWNSTQGFYDPSSFSYGNITNNTFYGATHGTATAINGMVAIFGGSNDIKIENNTFNITGSNTSAGGYSNGIILSGYAKAAVLPTTNITIRSNNIFSNANTSVGINIGQYVANSTISYNNLSFTGVNSTAIMASNTTGSDTAFTITPRNITIFNNTCLMTGSSSQCLLLNRSVNFNVSNNTLNSTLSAINLTNSGGNKIINNTLSSTGGDTLLIGGAEDGNNSIYYNNFSQNGGAGKYYVNQKQGAATDKFNTTIGNGGQAQGNWYADLQFLAITYVSGWGASGASYPYSATTTANWTGSGNDPGPGPGITIPNTTTIGTIGTGVNPIYQNSPIPWNLTASTNGGVFRGANCSLYQNTVNVSSLNYTCNGGYCSNSTAYGILNSSPSIFGIGDQLILSCRAYTTEAGITNSSYVNSSTYTILDNIPQITNLMITPNASIYKNATINGNLTVSHNDTSQTSTASYSWYKSTDGGATYVNQTTLAGTFSIYNNTPNWTALNLLGIGTNVGDMWKFGVQVNDTLNWTNNLNTSPITITGDISNLTMNTTYLQQYDLMKWGSGLNFTYGPGITVSGVSAQYGGSVWAASLTSSSGGSVQYNVSIQPPFSSTTNNYTITWIITGTYANGSILTQQNQTNANNTNPYTIQVNASGLYPCNSSINTNSLNYTFLDSNSSASINATLTETINLTSANGSIKSLTFTGTNNTLQVCISPSWANINASIGEVANASNYITTQTSRSINASSTLNNISILLLPNALAEATILTVNQFPNIPIPGAYITIEQFIAPSNYTLFKTCNTGGDGTCLVYLTPNVVYYRYNISAPNTNTSYGPEILSCSPTQPNCFRTFVLNTASLPYQNVGNFSGSCSYANNTGILTCSATDLGTTITTWNLSATYLNASQYCLNTTSGSTATLKCSFDITTPNTYGFSFNGYDANGNQYPISLGQIVIPVGITDSFGRSGWLAILLLFGIIAMAGFQSPGLSMVLGIAAIIFGAAIGLVPIVSIQSAVIASAVMAGILMWKMRV